MDIFNNAERQVVCVENDIDSTFPGFEDNTLLTVGQKYTVIDVEVHSWHTLVTLREFPNKRFNSVLFAEIDEKVETTAAVTNPVEAAYQILVAYRDANMIPDMGTIEELIGYLGQALA